METLETKQLLGYTLEIFEIGEFKEYYDEHTTQFNDFARNQFLKAISIPPAYFLEQPAETQEELLCNKLELVGVQKKYQGLSIIVVSQGNEILNATKIKTNEVEVQYEAISSIEEVENIVWSRSLVKDGYICGYLVCGTVSREGYNRALFIDFPILFNKPTIIHELFIELANPKMTVEKDMVYYTKTDIVDYTDYQHIALAIDDYMLNIELTTPSIRESKDNKAILREPVDVICELIEEKIVPKSLLFHMAGYLDKQIEDGKELTRNSLLEAVIAFDCNVKALKQINALRGCKKVIDRMLIEDESEDTE